MFPLCEAKVYRIRGNPSSDRGYDQLVGCVSGIRRIGFADTGMLEATRAVNLRDLIDDDNAHGIVSLAEPVADACLRVLLGSRVPRHIACTRSPTRLSAFPYSANSSSAYRHFLVPCYGGPVAMNARADGRMRSKAPPGPVLLTLSARNNVG